MRGGWGVLEDEGKSLLFYLCIIIIIDFRERKGSEGERKGNIDLLLHLFKHSLVDACTCHNWESNLQPRHSQRTL